MSIAWPPYPEPIAPPDAIRPRYVQETFAEAIIRVPALEPFSNRQTCEVAAEAFDLVDSLPGYMLVQAVTASYEPPVFVFRRIDPAPRPISLQTF